MDSWILSEAKQRREDLRRFVVRDRLGRSEKASQCRKTFVGSAQALWKLFVFLTRQIVKQLSAVPNRAK